MGNWTEFRGKLTITPPLTNEEIRSANESLNDPKNSGMFKQWPDSSFVPIETFCWDCSWYVSSSGQGILCEEFDGIYEGKGYLKYLIEHGIKKTPSKVNGEIVYLNEYGSFGILGVENNEVYTINYLKEINFFDSFVGEDLEEKKNLEPTVDNVPKILDNLQLIPAIFRYDIAQKVTRNTTFTGSLNVTRIISPEKYDMIRRTKEEYIEERVVQDSHTSEMYFPAMRDAKRKDRETRRRQYFNEYNDYPLIAEYKKDGTVGDKSLKSEWIFSHDNMQLSWSGKTFIAAHNWLAYLAMNCCECHGSIKWENEKNEQGLLSVENIEVLEGYTRSFVFIEFNGEKFLANVSWCN
ncbi:uncharacterized protein PRCAT00002515001 [Priceomyces carsonii]|uniref:uncharacterized protein n=1 Tax=Priceomyces carsonii TaxID=28549 RepID=UPI002ED7ED19|nr:unnamed protein product [Priceomyces carsonii]